MTTRYSYTKQDTEEAQQRAKPAADQWLLFSVDAEKFQVQDKSGNMTASLKCSPFVAPTGKKEDKRPGYAVYMNLSFPLSNPKKAGHKANNMAGIFKQALQAFEFTDKDGKQCPPSVTRDPDTQNLTLNGKPLSDDPAEATKLAKENEARVMDWVYAQAAEACELLEDITDGKKKGRVFKDYLFYAKTVQNGEFLNITNLQPKLPKGEKYGFIKPPKATPTAADEVKAEEGGAEA